ncbi:MAG: cyclopropane-fatty-acyl-phospholipid synthase family protein [Acidimicrobiia bacterium]|nr:cyclopropane-fatty-acyl-phospholipid synthase family protein [Acidimicrobiia bacterium]MBT8193033.1 cyclopropane-fatty-acyl-phospholipid synthase family protein [Acidimicrobiia bacterium]MBT8246686.1 cyclopropane-fatty-acyl-phospholipid synthase family protein [Acidimicrobiia bacterium]NNF87620.1 class I SAM-dependent methyltransferase [Acidimicrobiia bacterium]NNJ47415.1 class I SAM-dependent methyltransferase [Acidimicrobiia bacterium]
MTTTAIAPSPLLSRFVRVGTLTVTQGSRTRLLTGGQPGPSVTVHIQSSRAWVRILRGGALGFAEAYMLGEIDTPDLAEFFVWGALNQEAFRSGRLGNRFFSGSRRLWQRLAADLPHRSVGSTTDHYDLGNDFYAEWLDESMSYSSARFEYPSQPMASAQRNKYATLARMAGIQPGDRVLEIGCGWGGFAEYAAGQLGCHVTAITLSTEMAEYARKRLSSQGLGHLVDIRIEDFRATAGTFDRVVSVEMIESVDESQWPALFATIRARLAPHGGAAMQAITIDDTEWHDYRHGQDFIQRYIFPGGQLPAPAVLAGLAGDNGLAITTDERFGADYARTLAWWHDRFEQVWPRLAGPQFDEHFHRMWKLYLTYCEAGFRLGRIDVHQIGLRPA